VTYETLTGLNFERIDVVMCCANNERFPDAYAAAFNILMNVSNARFKLCMNEELNAANEQRAEMLKALGGHTHNEVTVLEFDPSFSKAKMISRVMFGSDLRSDVNSRPWHLNVDDDFMIPYRTLSLIAQASFDEDRNSAMYIYGLFDVINFRDYEDWSAEKVTEEGLFTFIAKNGMRCLNNHLCDSIPDEVIRYEIPGNSTGSYMFNRDLVWRNFPQSFLNILEDWPKGKRGYDDFLCKHMAGLGKAYWMFGSNNFHTDLTRAHVDGKIWKEDVFRDDHMLGDTQKGRIPVKEVGAMSIPRGERPEDAPVIPSVEPGEA
jgi:hypothetical protein